MIINAVIAASWNHVTVFLHGGGLLSDLHMSLAVCLGNCLYIYANNHTLYDTEIWIV